MNRIKFLRESYKFTQKELAEKLNVTEGCISQYENGTRNPSLDIIIKLAELFDCSIDYILGKTDKKKFTVEEELIQIGLSTNDYKKPTKDQIEQIKQFVEFVLKDNKK